MCGLERALVSTLEAVVLARMHGHLEGFARYILQTTTAGAVESGPAQRFAVAAAVADAQPTVLPQLALRAEAVRCVNVSTEATGADRTLYRGLLLSSKAPHH